MLVKKKDDSNCGVSEKEVKSVLIDGCYTQTPYGSLNIR
jgi:hypothetical protein